MSHLFISYSAEDSAFALSLADHLENYYPIWIDREGISGGAEWERTIEAALADADAFVVIVSPRSNESQWVRRETIRAEQLGLYRIPVLIEGELPLRLLDIQYIDFRGEFDGGFRDLLEALGKKLTLRQREPAEINTLLGEGVRAYLAGDVPHANSLIGQALALQPDIAASVEAFWQSLREVRKTDYAAVLSNLLGRGIIPIKEYAEPLMLPEGVYSAGTQAIKWSIRLDVDPVVLGQIDFVKYTLHPTFAQPERVVRDRASAFELSAVGWGRFDIPVEVHFVDGTVTVFDYELQLAT
jgi:TIR domain-containing protein/pYEATS domain-containing protein involved in immunity